MADKTGLQVAAMDDARYAVYFVPPQRGALYAFGIAVLGYDCYTGQATETAHGPGLSASEWTRLTEEPRRYGFHATLKAPFRLRSPFVEGDLIDAFADFARVTGAPPPARGAIKPLDAFVALVARGPTEALDALAERCVREFDRFRAPLSPRERDRRSVKDLTPRQIAQLEHWGYPYVGADFRFHLTLTGRLKPAQIAPVCALLRVEFKKRQVAEEFPVGQIALLRQIAPDYPFMVIRTCALAPA
ncbi:MAG: DUF1045 domain-containing protein [Proteobacteria bacterium]|nr:DUF1045 domain-containing protein [Pseudomonadota bacterium]